MTEWIGLVYKYFAGKSLDFCYSETIVRPCLLWVMPFVGDAIVCRHQGPNFGVSSSLAHPPLKKEVPVQSVLTSSWVLWRSHNTPFLRCSQPISRGANHCSHSQHTGDPLNVHHSFILSSIPGGEGGVLFPFIDNRGSEM